MPVSVSVGVAQWTEPQTAGELLDRADRALLLAKRRGEGHRRGGERQGRARAGRDSRAGRRPSEFMNEFWDTVAACEEPREVLFVLPAFLLRQLGLEEVALYDSPRDSVGGAARAALPCARARRSRRQRRSERTSLPRGRAR